MTENTLTNEEQRTAWRLVRSCDALNLLLDLQHFCSKRKRQL